MLQVLFIIFIFMLVLGMIDSLVLTLQKDASASDWGALIIGWILFGTEIALCAIAAANPVGTFAFVFGILCAVYAGILFITNSLGIFLNKSDGRRILSLGKAPTFLTMMILFIIAI